MTEIYLIRHTQAEGNVYHAMQGHWDGDVTALGLRQLDALAERFRGVKLDALYSSDLHRAMLTADALRRFRPMELRTLFDLREINVGPWEARFFADIQHEQPREAELFLHRAEDFYLPGAERYGDVRRRAAAALERIARENDGGGVTHLFFEDGRYTVDYINDCAHLAMLALPEWDRTPNLRAEPFSPAAEAAFYTACYAEAWQSAHGTLEGFSPETYLAAAESHHRADEGCVLRFFEGGKSAGMLDLDPKRGAHAGCGWISLLYLEKEYRDRGLGVQLLGRALMYFRLRGRRAVRLQAAEDNAAALRFYEKHGFRRLSSENGRFGKLYLMEYRFGESHV